MIPNIEPISTADRERAKELCAKATPGPWAWSEGYCSLDAAPMEHVLWPQNSLGEPEDAAQAVGACGLHTEPYAEENLELIAFSRTAIPQYEVALAYAEEDATQNLDRWKAAADELAVERARVVELEAALADLQQVRANLEADVIRLRKEYGAERYWEARWRDEEARATALLEALRPFAQVARNLPGYIGDDAALRITVTRTLHGIRRQNTLSVDGVNAGDLRRVAAIRTHEAPNDHP